MIHVYVHYPTKQEAEKISRILLTKRLVACVNFINQSDLYWWKGKIVSSRGVVTLAAAPKTHYKKIEALVKKHHSFDIPCILELPVTHALASYNNWLNAETKKNSSK